MRLFLTNENERKEYMKNSEQEYRLKLKSMTDEQVIKEAQTQLGNGADQKLDWIIDECERREKPEIMEEVYVWYSLST
ncbi:hypothetical protein SY83_17460 [Paenibacillus swuensis]|uniref:Uncharacterized protein n=1 Tax=Paenibacillus swuensis TaxID=1178515 RepID=A0A172TLI7_9BACL|nr:hypothetical protein SY83_17460 [Paenibacillus swuensis]